MFAKWAATKIAVAIFFSLTSIAGANETVISDEANSIFGIAKLDGPAPKRMPITLVDKDGKPSDCHQLHKDGLLDEHLIVNENGGIANVFVFVQKGVPRKNHQVPKVPAVLDQVDCMFRPRVQGILVGQGILMRNSDPVIHNVRSLSLKNRAFNIAQPAKTPDRNRVFDKLEREIKIQCDFHPWMTAYIFVMDHPYFAVTDDRGQFAIKGLPPGEYALSAWHEQLGEQKIKVSLDATKSATIEFSFKASGGRNRLIGGTTGSDSSPKNANSVENSEKKKRRFVKMWKIEDFSGEETQRKQNSWARGRTIFADASCVKCHPMANKGTKLGPDLTEVSKRFTGTKLLEQILKPSSEIHKDFQTQVFTTDDGKTIAGLVVKEDGESVHVLPNPLKPDDVSVIQKSNIERRFTSKLSTMPEGLLMTFEKHEILDLLSFLEAGGKASE